MENCLCHPPNTLSFEAQPASVVDPSRRFDAVRSALLADFANVVVAGARPIRQLATSHPQALGNILPESWAIVSEILAFYDVRNTEGSFIGSATDHVTLKRLADLLGYLPLPAVASAAHVALVGSQTDVPTSTLGLTLRASTPSPQIFEPDEVKVLSWIPRSVTLAPLRETEMSFDESDDTIKFLLEAATAAPRRGSPVLFLYGYRMYATEIIEVTPSQELDGSDYVEVIVTNPTTFNTLLKPPLLAVNVDTPVEVRNVSILSPAQRAFVRTSLFGIESPYETFDDEFAIADAQTLEALDYKPGGYGPKTKNSNIAGAASSTTTTVILDGVYRSIKIADLVIVQRGPKFSPHRVIFYYEDLQAIGAGDDAPRVPLSTIKLSPKLPDEFIEDGVNAKLIIHYNLHDIGRLIIPAHSELTPALLKSSGPLDLEGFHHKPSPSPYSGKWLLEDANGRGALVDATFTMKGDRGRATLTLTGDPTWDPPLRAPVVAHPNILHVTRGETVHDEVLGNGDPTVASQSFQLKKSPLTYVQVAGGERGARTTLEVRVDGVLWHERRTFYGAGPGEHVYIVRQDDDERSRVIFGDGVRGARLPAGARNVRATYRFGAGAEAPPFANLTQIVRGVPGLTRVRNPVAASGGADREGAEEIRKNAPISALILGRCVSLTDFRARVASYPGVLNSRVELAWDDDMLAAVVKVWFVPSTIGDAELGDRIVGDLQALSEPGTQIQAVPAVPVRTYLSLEITVHPDYIAADVEKAVVAALVEPRTGALAPGNTPIGGVLSRSALVATALAIPGVLDVVGMQIRLADGGALLLGGGWLWSYFVDFPAPGLRLLPGLYLDFSDPSLPLLTAHATAAVARDCCDLGS